MSRQLQFPTMPKTAAMLALTLAVAALTGCPRSAQQTSQQTAQQATLPSAPVATAPATAPLNDGPECPCLTARQPVEAEVQRVAPQPDQAPEELLRQAAAANARGDFSVAAA